MGTPGRYSRSTGGVPMSGKVPPEPEVMDVYGLEGDDVEHLVRYIDKKTARKVFRIILKDWVKENNPTTTGAAKV